MAGNILDEFKLRLTSDPLPGAKVYGERKASPQLAIRVKDNQPRLVVYTNVENDKNNGIIEAAMDSIVMYSLFEALREIANGTRDGIIINNRGHSFGPQGRSAEPHTLSQTRAGVNDDGIICISVIAKNRPEAVFKFGPHEWHPMIDKKGNPIPMREVSRIVALAYINVMERAVASVLQTEFISYADLKARKEANSRARSGGNGGQQQRPSYNNNNNNSGGNNNSAPAAGGDAGFGDTDIPW